MRFWLRQFISIGSLTTSWIFSITKSIHSCTNIFICKKSLDIRIEMTFLISSFGIGSSLAKATSAPYSFSLRYFISHSNILMSQCTLISMSSTEVASVKYFSKYFMCVTKRSFSQVKSLLIFLFSSNTCITMTSVLFLPKRTPAAWLLVWELSLLLA